MGHRLLGQSFKLTIGLGTCATLLLGASESGASEARCDELGIHCVCSEPLNTSAFTTTLANWKNPADSTTRQCSTESSLPGAAIEVGGLATAIPRNDAVILSALPSGHGVQWVWGGRDDHTGIYLLGHNHDSAQYLARLSARFYVYRSTDFEFAGDAACENAKLMQFTGPNSLLDTSFGPIHMYNFLDFPTDPQDCCLVGPGPDAHAITKESWRGKWWRIEAIYSNRQGPGWAMRVYARNVTDDGPELLVIDTTALNAQLRNPVNRTPPRRQDAMKVNLYRQGSCRGFEAVSHYMLAGWDTDEGQRIGAATEVEGHIADVLPRPENLRIVR